MCREYSWYEFPQIMDTVKGREHIGIIVEFQPIREMLEKTNRIAILSAPLAFPNHISLSVGITPRTFKEIIDIAKKLEIPIVSYHGHQGTLDVINKLFSLDLSANRQSYQPEIGDIAVAIRLKKRLEKPEDIENVTLDDLDFILIQYVKLPVQ